MPAEESTGIDDTDSALDTDEPCAGGTPPPLDFQRQLEKILNIAAGATPESLHAPIVGPPIYAAQYAGLSTLPGEGQPPLWLRDLNLDPRYRVAASLGAMVVHHQQEQLLASAWDQLAQARRVNQTLRQLQAAREVSRAVHTAHLKPLAQHQLWQLTRAAHSRVMPTGATTLEAQVRASRLPEGALAPTVRRLARPQGPLVRRRTLTTNPTAAAPEEPLPLVESMNVPNGLLAAPPRQAPSGTISMTAVRNVGYAPASPDSVRSASGWATWDSTGTGSPTAGESKALPGARNGGPEDGGAVRWADPLDYRIPRPPLILKTYFDQMTANFRSAATLCQQYLERIETQLAVPPVDPPPVASDRQALLGQLHPDLTVHSAATDRITTEINIWRRRDKLDPVTAAPQYSYPMWEPLADLSPEWLLPNLEAVPDPAVAVLTCNSRFLEAYVAGLNHALGKEFLWRDFPSHQVATYFRSFWQEGRPDIPDFEEWDGRGLGEHAVAPALVLLVRSALLARYPTASISAVPAAVVDGVRVPSGNELTPLLRVTVKPDIALAGFDLSPAAATGQDGGQGWFFVIEQHVTEPRFGLEPPQSSDFGQAPVDWAHFSWGNLATAPDQLAMLTYASARQAVLATNAGGLAWGPGSDSGNVAAITLRKPVRVAIHASAILPVPQGPGSGSQ